MIKEICIKNNNIKRALFLYLKLFFCFLFLSYGSFLVAKQKKPMKILMIVSSFPNIHEVSVLNQITGLIDRGHVVHIYASKKADCTNVQEDVIAYDLLNKTFFKKLPSNLNSYDIVMFQFGNTAFDIKAKYNFKGKVIICLRGYDITGFLRKNLNFYNQYFDTCDLFMPVCEAFKSILKQEGCSADKIIVHHSAIDLSRFIFNPKNISGDETINIVSPGRFIEKKGFEYSIDAIAQLVKKYKQIHYTIIGDGILKEKYNQLINQLGVNNNIKLDGWHAHDEYINILDKSHILILPSVTAENNDQEGIANVLKEAMAMGVLVITTDHSGNSELIENGISGLLVPERDSIAIYNTVKYFLNHPKQWLPMQLAAVKKVNEEFDKEKQNNQLEALLYDLLQQ